MRSSDRSLPVPDRRDRHHAPRPRPAAGGKRTGRDTAEAAPVAVLPRALVALREAGYEPFALATRRYRHAQRTVLLHRYATREAAYHDANTQPVHAVPVS